MSHLPVTGLGSCWQRSVLCADGPVVSLRGFATLVCFVAAPGRARPGEESGLLVAATLIPPIPWDRALGTSHPGQGWTRLMGTDKRLHRG